MIAIPAWLSLTDGPFLTARTFVLTGMPTIGPDALFALWQTLGLHLHAPAGTLQWSKPHDWSSQPSVSSPCNTENIMNRLFFRYSHGHNGYSIIPSLLYW
jgi:hypothetical protein